MSDMDLVILVAKRVSSYFLLILVPAGSSNPVGPIILPYWAIINPELT